MINKVIVTIAYFEPHEGVSFQFENTRPKGEGDLISFTKNSLQLETYEFTYKYGLNIRFFFFPNSERQGTQ